tara:strand:+ start:216 stop:1079 length:864 start_codon:yes stop_codon:yes gene_type:complete
MSHNFYIKYKKEIDRFIDQALIEDIENLDHTSKACLDDDLLSSAKLEVKEDCIIAGIDLAEKIYSKIDSSIKIIPFFRDGSKLPKGSIAFTVNGPAKSLLASERLVLNCMQKMSGIASLANHLNKKINHTNCQILDTRKTTPGFRYPEKWAVSIGGGYNHRMGLFDAIMVKDNHVDFCGGMEKALIKIKCYLDKNQFNIPVIVEVRNQDEIEIVMRFPWVKRILLDNMTPSQLSKEVSWINNAFETEASGNINFENLIQYAETGVNFISMGALTHSAKNIDMSLKAL